MATKKKTKRTWKPVLGAKLGPQEKLLRDRLTNVKAAVAVSVLFRHVAPKYDGNAISPRKKQQRIGAIAARHNRKVKSPHIVSGDKPGTYRLKRVR